jgi:hypothetical protein
MRESYLGTYSLKDGSGSPSGSAQLRIEFYYISSDADKTIYGVSTAMIPTANTPTYLIGWQRVYGVTTNADGTINLLDYQGNKILSNFKRISTVGGNTQGELACDTVVFNCSTNGAGFQQTFKLNALSTL